jgi:excisionase family DNA binding protein
MTQFFVLADFLVRHFLFCVPLLALPDRLLTLAECAARTGHKISTWRAWLLRRRVPFYKIGRSVRILESDLDRMIRESRVPARPRSGGRNAQ